MKNLVRLTLTVVMLLTSLNAKEITLDGLLEKMIDVCGGTKNITDMESYEQIWLIEAKAGTNNGTDHRTVSLPNSLRTELTYPDKKEIRVLVDGHGIKEFDGVKVKASGPMLDAMKLQLMRIYNPLILKNKIEELSFGGSNESDYTIVLKEDGVEAEYFVSKKSYLIEKVIGTLFLGNQSMEFKTLYENYEKQHGVMMPTKEIKYAGDTNTAVMSLQATKIIKN